jgi:deazaflavin-dependent oxidoreductase (nitroreductase family)
VVSLTDPTQSAIFGFPRDGAEGTPPHSALCDAGDADYAGTRWKRTSGEMTSKQKPSLLVRLARRPALMAIGRRLHRLGNPMTAALLKSPLHGMLSGSVALLTATGRKTGTAYVFPVQYARSGAIVVIVPGDYRHKRWWRNLRSPRPVQIRIAGRDHSGTGQALAGAERPEEVADGLALYLAHFRHSAEGRDLWPDKDGKFDRARLLAVAAGEVIVRIVLDEAAGAT